jgi:uncharacterized membrane protein HdeD (DUF308 family)
MALRGVLAVVFGIIALRSPGIAAAAFVIVFAVWAFADGVLDLAMAARFGRAGLSWGWYALMGIVSIGLGVLALAYPRITLLALVLLVAIRAIVVGIFELVAAFSWEVESRWLLGLTGLLSIVFGVLIFGSPAIGTLALIWTIGVYAIIIGVGLFVQGVKAIRFEHRETRFPGQAAPAT